MLRMLYLYFSYLRLQLLQVCSHSIRHPAEEHPEGGGHQLRRILHSLARQGWRCRHGRGHRFWMAQGNFCQLESLLLARLNLQHTTWWMVFLMFLFICVFQNEPLCYFWAPLVLIGVWAFIIAHCFIGVYSVSSLWCFIKIEANRSNFWISTCDVRLILFCPIADGDRYNIPVFLWGRRQEWRDHAAVLHEPGTDGLRRELTQGARGRQKKSAGAEGEIWRRP